MPGTCRLAAPLAVAEPHIVSHGEAVLDHLQGGLRRGPNARPAPLPVACSHPPILMVGNLDEHSWQQHADLSGAMHRGVKTDRLRRSNAMEGGALLCVVVGPLVALPVVEGD